MKRNPRKLKWTKAFRKAAGKEMVVDSTLQFAARRNVPLRYNRSHIETTLKAMQRVSEIRARRERVFYKKRMAGNKERQREADRKLVEENQHLLPVHLRSAATLPAQTEDMAVETLDEKVLAESQKQSHKAKQRLLVNGAVAERMDMDG